MIQENEKYYLGPVVEEEYYWYRKIEQELGDKKWKALQQWAWDNGYGVTCLDQLGYTSSGFGWLSHSGPIRYWGVTLDKPEELLLKQRIEYTELLFKENGPIVKIVKDYWGNTISTIFENGKELEYIATKDYEIDFSQYPIEIDDSERCQRIKPRSGERCENKIRQGSQKMCSVHKKFEER